jgi:hypothetical protein
MPEVVELVMMHMSRGYHMEELELINKQYHQSHDSLMSEIKEDLKELDISSSMVKGLKRNIGKGGKSREEIKIT